MTLESGTYISDLNASNPSATDPKSQGDDHIRLLKSTVQNTFPNVTGEVARTHVEINSVIDRSFRAGDTYSGAHDFGGAVEVIVPTPVASQNPATKGYADGLAFSTVLPGQSGNAGKIISTDGDTASWVAITDPAILSQIHAIALCF